jgi:hypothetical protein
MTGAYGGDCAASGGFSLAVEKYTAALKIVKPKAAPAVIVAPIERTGVYRLVNAAVKKTRNGSQNSPAKQLNIV